MTREPNTTSAAPAACTNRRGPTDILPMHLHLGYQVEVPQSSSRHHMDAPDAGEGSGPCLPSTPRREMGLSEKTPQVGDRDDCPAGAAAGLDREEP